ncbi:transporter [Aquimarina algicola]|nr:transporter [Aquimarina algicola]
MIKSAIFEANLFNMNPKSILLYIVVFISGLASLTAQYTEKINTNRPGVSQGAFSVGNNVLQLEGGLGFGKEKHDILNTKTNVFNFDYAIRYGLLIEQLEIMLDGKFRADGVRQTIGANEEKINRSDFQSNTIGAKYLIYDPYKKPKEEDSTDYSKLKSWKERYKFRWKSLIPAVSGYLGANFISADNPFTAPNDDSFSPKIVVMTQNNWTTSINGQWVLVTNLIFDKITTDDPIFGWIITSTHTLNDKWAAFVEYQGQKSDFYSDNILRTGGAYLFNKDLQFDANVAFNFKDTPSLFTVSFGASYRFDWHTKDEIIEQPGLEGGVKEEEIEGEQENEEGTEEGEEIEGLEEGEEIENDSLKLGKTPFINDFEDDSFREELERDLDERRTEERLERERIENEKIAKKEGKKFKKEEARRLKREAKEARKAEKAAEKAEKEKQKMIEEIDAELDKMEQDEGTDQELEDIEKELKNLEKEFDVEEDDKKQKKEEKKKDEEEKAKEIEEEDIDAEYEKYQKEQEKQKKAEEKRRKKEEKRRQKEEKKRKKEEEKQTEEEENLEKELEKID